MALASPFFRAFELARRVELVVPELSFGSPLDGGPRGPGLPFTGADSPGAWPGRCGLPETDGPDCQPHRRRDGPDPAPAPPDPQGSRRGRALRAADAGAGLGAVEHAVQGRVRSGFAQRRGGPCGVASALAGRRRCRPDAECPGPRPGLADPAGRFGVDRGRTGGRHPCPRRRDPYQPAGGKPQGTRRRPGNAAGRGTARDCSHGRRRPAR